VLAGAIGALIWSRVADALSARIPNARLIVPAVAAVLTTVFMCAAFVGMPPGNAQFLLIVAGGFVMAGSIGPTDAVVVDVIHPALRATAASVLSLMRNLFGLAGGPLLAGMLSDAYGLQFAMEVVPLICLAAAAVFLRPGHRAPSGLGQSCVPDSEGVEGLGITAAAPVGGLNLVGHIGGQPGAQLLTELLHLRRV
jgi:MFS family permease